MEPEGASGERSPGLYSLPEDVLEKIASMMKTCEWAVSGAAASKVLRRIPLRTVDMTPGEWPGLEGDAESMALPANIGSTTDSRLLSALSWMAQRSGTAETLSFLLDIQESGPAGMPGHRKYQDILHGSLLCFKLRAAKIGFGNRKGMHPAALHAWLHCLLQQAVNLQTLFVSQYLGVDSLPPGLSLGPLKHLGLSVPAQGAGPDWSLPTLLCTVSGLPCLETLQLHNELLHPAHFKACDELDLRSCTRLRRVALLNIGPASLQLPSMCTAELMLPADVVDDAASSHIWQACAGQVSSLQCTGMSSLPRRELHTFPCQLQQFEGLTSLQLQNTWESDEESYLRIPMERLLSQRLACISKLTLRLDMTTCPDEFNGVVEVCIPASMYLQTLVVISIDCYGALWADDAVDLTFQDPAGIARSLNDLFVPGADMAGNALLMADAFHAKGLMLSAVRCPHFNGGFYVYLKPVTAGARTWEGLVAEYACACGACWECCQAGLQM